MTNVDTSKGMVRVVYKRLDNMPSGWLPVLQRAGEVVRVEAVGNHTHGQQSPDGAHSHSASVTGWMPKINDRVLVLHLPVFNGDGFVLGGI